MEILIPSLNDKSEVPLYRQLIEGFQNRIRRGELAPGTRLPSTRELAEQLGLSRTTTSRAYEELSREGWIRVLPASGTFVCRMNASLPEIAEHMFDECQYQARLSNYGERIMSDRIEPADVELTPELNFCAPAPEQLPLRRWRHLVAACSRDTELSYRSYLSDVFGHEELRKTLANYLARVRGLDCTHEQVAIFSGAQPALDLLSRILIEAGDVAVVENPGFPGARRTFASYGAKLHTVPTDQDGADTRQLPETGIGAKVMYVTPSHHDPSGVVLSTARRQALLDWASASGCLVIEDDFDSEYRYGEKPLPALQSMDKKGIVLYLSSFWKIMFPVLRMGFVVVPPALVPTLRRAKSLVERDFHFVEHEALARFIKQGYLEKHVRKTRAIYARRRQQLIARLNKHLGSSVRISPVSAGTHLLIRFEDSLNESRILAAAKQAGLPVMSTAAYYVGQHSTNEMLMPFAHIDEQAISTAVEHFAQLI